MRQAINNVQSTHSGFGIIEPDYVFKVCDQPHPMIVQDLIRASSKPDVEVALTRLNELWNHGYSSLDIIGTMAKVTQYSNELQEWHKLNYLKVCFRYAMRFYELPFWTRHKIAIGNWGCTYEVIRWVTIASTATRIGC